MKFNLIPVFLFFFFGKIAIAQNAVDIQNYINKYKDIAISEMRRSGVPASITIAQGIHETLAGTSDLVLKSNNHFGIKCKNTWTGSVVYHDDDERGECFRSYDKPEDSYRDHSDFLRNSPRYAFLFKLDPTDYSSWAYGLKKAGYATNIRYPQILIKLIEDYNLQQYTMIALGKGVPNDTSQFVKEENSATNPPSQSISSETNIANKSSEKPSQTYPSGEFEINKSRVIFAKAGTSLLLIANQYNISLNKLIDFNDLTSDDVLAKDQLVFLVRKRKISNLEFHIVKSGETVYDICQSEGVRYDSLLEMNQLVPGMEPAIGEKIYLQSVAPARPMLAGQKSK